MLEGGARPEIEKFLSERMNIKSSNRFGLLFRAKFVRMNNQAWLGGLLSMVSHAPALRPIGLAALANSVHLPNWIQKNSGTPQRPNLLARKNHDFSPGSEEIRIHILYRDVICGQRNYYYYFWEFVYVICDL